MSQITPPMMPGELQSAEPPAWPKVIGIFSIVWGSLAIICGVCGAVMVFATGPFMEWAASLQSQSGQQGPGVMPTGPLPAELKMNIVTILGAIIAPIGGLVLLFGGISLVQRSPASRTLHIAYALISLLGTSLGMIGAIIYARTINAYVAANPGDAWGVFMSSQSGGTQFQVIQAGVISCFGALYPLFVLVWFLLVKRTNSDLVRVERDPYV